MLAGLIAPRLCLGFASATPWLRSPASIVARRVITLIMRLGTEYNIMFYSYGIILLCGYRDETH